MDIEKFTCTDSNEATKRERYWLETLGATLNYKIPSRTQSEYKESRKESIVEYQRNYREQEEHKKTKAVINQNWYAENKERLLEKINCPCGVIHCYASRLDHLKSAGHLAYIENPEVLRPTKIPGFDCPCGGRYHLVQKERHSKTTRHIRYLDSIESPPLAI